MKEHKEKITALAIIDMQNDFVFPDSPLCVAGAFDTISVIRSLLDFARAASWPIFHIIREHRLDGSDVERSRVPLFTEGRGICVPGTPGSGIVKELAPLSGEYVIRKRRFSGFMHTELDLLLRRLGVSLLVIAGTQYPNCVRATAVDAMSLDYDVVVITDACSAQTEDIALSNIRDLRNMHIQCIEFAEFKDSFARQ